MPTTDAIRAAMSQPTPAAFVSAMKHAVAARAPGTAELAIECLGDDRHGIRNASALALMELKAPGAGDALRAALARPGVAAQSGTLVYALHELGERIDMPAATAIVTGGSYEAKCEMVEMLFEDLLDPDGDDDRDATMAEMARIAADGGDAGWSADAVIQAIGRHEAGNRPAA